MQHTELDVIHTTALAGDSSELKQNQSTETSDFIETTHVRAPTLKPNYPAQATIREIKNAALQVTENTHTPFAQYFRLN